MIMSDLCFTKIPLNCNIATQEDSSMNENVMYFH